jgi:hypothetical protein
MLFPAGRTSSVESADTGFAPVHFSPWVERAQLLDRVRLAVLRPQEEEAVCLETASRSSSWLVKASIMSYAL